MKRNYRWKWTQQEDSVLIGYIKRYGVNQWNEVSELFNQKFNKKIRSPQCCKQRWEKHLNPRIKKFQWSDEEIWKIFSFHKILGNKWKQISIKLQKRNDSDTKNQFFNNIRKGLRRMYRQSVNMEDNRASRKISSIKPKKLSEIISILRRGIPNQIQQQKQIYQIIFKFSRLTQNQNYQDKIKQIDAKRLLSILEKVFKLNQMKIEKKRQLQSDYFFQSKFLTQRLEEQGQKAMIKVNQTINEQQSFVNCRQITRYMFIQSQKDQQKFYPLFNIFPEIRDNQLNTKNESLEQNMQ